MNILVTGGAGYIGSHVAKLLLEKTNHNLTILDNLSTGFYEAIKTLKGIRDFDFVERDLSNWNEVEYVFRTKGFDAVIHFAASLIVPESVEKPIKYYLNNTANGTNLIGLCLKYDVNRFIFSSTAAVYGEPEPEDAESGISENFPVNPINPYGRSKLFVENILKDAAFAQPEFKYVVLRYFNVAGASLDLKIGQRTKNATHLIKVAAQTALGIREKMFIFGNDYPTRDGTCIRDYIHVCDLAKSHIQALDYLEGNPSDVFNVGYGRGYTVKEVVDTMKMVSGVDFEVRMAPRRLGDPAILIANSNKIKQKMGFKPDYNSLETICKTALEWEKKLIDY